MVRYTLLVAMEMLICPFKGVIIGTSSMAHTEQNLKAVEQGPLPEHILDALNAAWEVAMVKCPPYYR